MWIKPVDAALAKIIMALPVLKKALLVIAVSTYI